MASFAAFGAKAAGTVPPVGTAMEAPVGIGTADAGAGGRTEFGEPVPALEDAATAFEEIVGSDSPSLRGMRPTLSEVGFSGVESCPIAPAESTCSCTLPVEELRAASPAGFVNGWGASFDGGTEFDPSVKAITHAPAAVVPSKSAIRLLFMGWEGSTEFQSCPGSQVYKAKLAPGVTRRQLKMRFSL
jgi:hypothetical protein